MHGIFYNLLRILLIVNVFKCTNTDHSNYVYSANNALRLPHSAKLHKRISFTCSFGDRQAVPLLELGVPKNKTHSTKKQSLRFLNLKSRRSLYKLQLKSPESTTYLQI